DAIPSTVGGVEIKRMMVCRQLVEILGVFPFAVCSAVSGGQQVIGDAIFEKVWFGAGFHGPVVPLPMQIVQIDDSSATELHSADFIGGCAGAGMVPRSDDQKMFRPGFGGHVCQMIAIEGERA